MLRPRRFAHTNSQRCCRRLLDTRWPLTPGPARLQQVGGGGGDLEQGSGAQRRPALGEVWKGVPHWQIQLERPVDETRPVYTAIIAKVRFGIRRLCLSRAIVESPPLADTGCIGRAPKHGPRPLPVDTSASLPPDAFAERLHPCGPEGAVPNRRWRRRGGARMDAPAGATAARTWSGRSIEAILSTC